MPDPQPRHLSASFPVPDDVQTTVLRRCAEWGDAHPCLKQLYIFGSTGRGDHNPDSDVDIAVEFHPLNGDEMVGDFTQLHSEADEFCLSLRAELNREARLHRMILSAPEDDAWPAIVAASERPVATLGKAMLVATPKKIAASSN